VLHDGNLRHELVVERGWTHEQYADWVGEIWVAMCVTP
jgi:hypothetical protein